MLKQIGIATSAGIIGLSMLAGVGTIVSAQESQQETQTDGFNFFERLASKLGISEEQLNEANKEVRYEILDEKVASGEIDEERAEEIKTKIEESNGMFMGPGFPKGMHMMKFRGNPEFLIEFLGISSDELQALEDEGLNMDEILEKYGKSKEELRTYMEENRPDNMMFKLKLDTPNEIELNS